MYGTFKKNSQDLSNKTTATLNVIMQGMLNEVKSQNVPTANDTV